MQWGQFFGAALVIAVIVILQWPRIKDNPIKDKGAFIVILVIGLVLSMFDLERMKGPITLFEAIFSPIGRYMGM